MKKNIVYICLIILLLLIIFALILTINLYNKLKNPTPIPVKLFVEENKEKAPLISISEETKETEYPLFLKYGIKPKEAKYYE